MSSVLSTHTYCAQDPLSTAQSIAPAISSAIEGALISFGMIRRVDSEKAIHWTEVPEPRLKLRHSVFFQV